MTIGHETPASGVILNQLYVAGGYDAVSSNSTERYDPASNRWTQLASAHVSRGNAASAVIGSELYVAGGCVASPPNGPDCSTVSNALEAYNANSDTWTTLASLPTPVFGAAGAALNGKFYVVGGSLSGYVPIGLVQVYDPGSNSWATSAAPMPTPRWYAEAAVMNNKIYVAGGEMGPPSYSPMGVLEVYDPNINTWAPLASMPTARRAFGIGVINGLMYTVGGDNTAADEAYDPAANSWSQQPAMPTARFGMAAGVINGVLYAAGGRAAMTPLTVNESFTPGSSATTPPATEAPGTWSATGSMRTARYNGQTATLLANGKVLVAGGYTPGSPPVTSTAELYDPATGSWSYTGSMNTGREGASATLLPNGKVLMTGGYTEPSVTIFATAELYDPATGTWTYTGSMETPRTGASTVLLPSGKVLVAGGEIPGGTPLPTSTAELYDPASGTWSYTGSMGTARWSASGTLLQSGKVLVAGGGTSPWSATAASELYDPLTGTWSPTGSMKLALSPTATLLASGSVLVEGAYVGGSPRTTATAEVYVPSAGTWSFTGSMGTERQYNTATLLPDGKVLVAGGYSYDTNTATATAELYDPAIGSWSPAGSMAQARSTGTATLLRNGQVLVAGGSDNSTVGIMATAELYTPADGTPPTTIATATPRPNANGWNNANVTVSLSATDNEPGGTGVRQITYSATGAQSIASTTVNGSSALIGIATEGTTTVSYYASDNAGNVEPVKSLTIQLDETPPTVSYSGNTGSYGVDQTVNITCTATDPQNGNGTAGSGIASTSCRNISGPAYTFAIGTNSYSATATDRAGNIGSGSTSFSVVVNVAGLSNLIGQFVTDPGVASSMQSQVASIGAAPTAHAKAGKLNAFTDLANAQTGKSLTASQAAILIRLAGGL